MEIFENQVSRILNTLVGKKISVLCGAGVSLNSGLPVVYQFLNALFDKFGLNQKERDLIHESGYPFEAIMELLQEEAGIDDLLAIFGLGEYNTNHLFLAHLAKEKILKNIVTTNFDTLIEQAFNKLGLFENTDYNVYANESEFAGIDWTNDRINLIKIHGTATDFESMAINMKMVATQTECVNKYAVVRSLFDKKYNPFVLIMGYSSSDVFDISPVIQSIEKDYSEVLYLEHIVPGDERIQDIRLQIVKNPFIDFPESYRLFAPTDAFVESAWNAFGFSGYEYKVREKVKWLPFIDKWFVSAENELTAGFKHQICGRLYHNICRYENSIEHYDKAIGIALSLNDETRFSSELGNLALTYNTVGRFDDAINCLTASLAACERIGNSQGLISQYQSLGNIYRNMGRYDQSEKSYFAGIGIIEKEGDESDLCTAFGNLVTLYNKTEDYYKTLFYGEKALELAGKLGIKQSEGSILCSLGTAYYGLGQKEKAIISMKKGVMAAQQIGNINITCLGQTNLALIYTQERDHQKALELLFAALPLAITMGTKQNEGLIYLGIGQNQASTGQAKSAAENFEKAKIIFEDIYDEGHAHLEVLYRQIAALRL